MVLGSSHAVNAEVITGVDNLPGDVYPNQEELEMTYSQTFATSDVDTDDYTMSSGSSGSKLMMDLDDMYIYSNEGESSAGSGETYISLEDSTVLGDYSSESNTWAERAFLETTFGSATQTGDTNADSSTAPSLSAGASDVYMKTSADFSTAATDVGSANEGIRWVADVWNDIDNDGVDDSATVTEEEYIPLTKDVYILVVAKIDSSDVDVETYGTVALDFYTGSTDYSVVLHFNGGSDVASTSTTGWTYASDFPMVHGATVLSENGAKLEIHEAEDEYVAILVDLADLISDDTDSSPNISGLNDITIGISAVDDYGDGTSDTIDFYVHNIAIFDELPAITDNDIGSGNTVDWNGAAANTASGDATYYDKHDILMPYIAAAANNDWNTKVYIENDISDQEELLNEWHMLKIVGTARLPPNRDFTASGGFQVKDGVTVETAVGEENQRRDVSLFWDMDQVRPSDGEDFVTSGRAASLSAHTLVQVLDDVYGSETKYEEQLISAELGGSNVFDDVESSWDSWTSGTEEITTDLWSTDPTDGDTIDFSYSYYTIESGGDSNDAQGNWNIAFPFAEKDANGWTIFGMSVGGIPVLGSFAVFGTAVFYFLFGRKKK